MQLLYCLLYIVNLHMCGCLATSIYLYACESWTLTAQQSSKEEYKPWKRSATARYYTSLTPHENLLTIVKRRKLQWYGHVSRSSGLAKTILQGTVKGGRRQGRQRKRWEDNIREWTGLEFSRSQRAVENREKRRKTGCEIICGAPTTLAVKG